MIKIPTRVYYSDKLILTTEQLAQFYECGTTQIKQNFNNNKDRFAEGTHYFKLEGDELKNLRVENFALQLSPMTRALYLWTKQGAARHAKMLTTEKAWAVFELLENSYFNTQLASTEKFLFNPDTIITICQNWKADREKLAALEVKVAELEPKANYCDKVLQCNDLLTTTDIAKDYGMSATKFNQLLNRLGVHFRHGDKWILYQKYARLGWAASKTHVIDGVDGKPHAKQHLYWTQKGRLGLYDLLKAHGYYPTAEQPTLLA